MKWLERFWYGCGHCHGEHACPLVEAAEESAQSPSGRGGPLVLACLAVFILPIAVTLICAWAAGRWTAQQSVGQAAGAIGGVIIGVALARLAAGRIVRHSQIADGGAE